MRRIVPSTVLLALIASISVASLGRASLGRAIAAPVSAQDTAMSEQVRKALDAVDQPSRPGCSNIPAGRRPAGADTRLNAKGRALFLVDSGKLM